MPGSPAGPSAIRPDIYVERRLLQTVADTSAYRLTPNGRATLAVGMTAEFTVSSRISLPVQPEVAFDYFEDPKSMLGFQGCVEAVGTIRPAGSGYLRFENQGFETRNDWHVVEHSRPKLCVISQRITTTQPGSPTVIEAKESNYYRRRLVGGCWMTRTTAYRYVGVTMTRKVLDAFQKKMRADQTSGLLILSKSMPIWALDPAPTPDS